jgi:hypothetical protein
MKTVRLVGTCATHVEVASRAPAFVYGNSDVRAQSVVAIDMTVARRMLGNRGPSAEGTVHGVTVIDACMPME